LKLFGLFVIFEKLTKNSLFVAERSRKFRERMAEDRRKKLRR
jgi:hypothetical protein